MTRKRQLTVAAVIHQPSREAFEMFDDLLLLGAGGSVMYHGELGLAEGYFRALGFSMLPGRNPAEFLLDVAQGEIEHDDLPACLHSTLSKRIYLLNEWHDKRGWAAERRWGALGAKERLLLGPGGGGGGGGRGESSGEDKDKDKDKSGEGQACGFRVSDSAFDQIQREMLAHETLLDASLKFYHETREHLGLIYADAVNAADYTHWPASLRVGSWQLYLCFKRSVRYYREERALAMYAEMAMHCVSGLIVSCAGQHLKFVGPMPSPVCAIQALPLLPMCYMPQAALYSQIGNFVCFGALFTAIASSAEVFSAEQPNYWRECSAGLLTVPYFLGNLLGNLPRMFLSALLFWLSFAFMYRDTGPGGGLFVIVLGIYWFGYSLGFVVSQLASPQNTALMGVLFALVFAVLFSGVLPALADVQTWPAWQQFPWSLSGPRFAIEAFYVNSVRVFATVPPSDYSSRFVGAPWVDVAAVLKQVGYRLDGFGDDVAGMAWDGVLWTAVALLLMYALNRPKTR